MITESSTEADEAASRLTLGWMNDCGVGIQRYRGIPPWEIHRDSDELLYVLDGEMELTVVGDDGPETAEVSGGMIVIVPKGRWHRPVAKSMVTLFQRHSVHELRHRVRRRSSDLTRMGISDPDENVPPTPKQPLGLPTSGDCEHDWGASASHAYRAVRFQEGQYPFAGSRGQEHHEPVGREVETMTKLDHLGVQVTDRNRARDWYVEALGLEVEFELPHAGVTAVRDESDFTIFLSEVPHVVPECVLYFQVSDVDRLHRSLADRGVTFVYAPQPNPWGYGAELLDPDGHTVRLWDERSMKR